MQVLELYNIGLKDQPDKCYPFIALSRNKKMNFQQVPSEILTHSNPLEIHSCQNATQKIM
jgi:hypothetical protein